MARPAPWVNHKNQARNILRSHDLPEIIPRRINRFSTRRSSTIPLPAAKMPSLFSPLALHSLRTLIHRPVTTAIKRSTTRFQPILRTLAAAQAFAAAKPSLIRQFSSSPFKQATYNQVRRGCRKAQAARRSRSPALINRSQMKGVCMKTGITKPKKPNSGERKTARVRLSSGKVVTAYIPGEGRSPTPLLFPSFQYV
jgi:small subunit ribosomal protein S12